MKEVQVLPHELSKNLDLIYQAIEDNSLSTNTKLAYKRDYAHFKTFSKGEFSTDIIKDYLFALASKGFKWSTITRRLSSIEHYHTIDKLELNKFVRGLKNTLHQNNHSQVLPKQANPISKELLLERILSLPLTRKAIRDKTIILFGWVGALRVSEIAAIKLEDIERTNEGLVLNIYHSKNIKSGSKQQKFYPYSSNVNLCPVRALEAYIREFAPGEGILFTQFRKGDVQLLKPITRASIQGLVETTFGKEYSAHSLRAGFITTAFSLGATTSEVMRQSKHKSISSLMLYHRNEVTRANAVSMVI